MIENQLSHIAYFFLIDNKCFLIVYRSASKIAKTLEKVRRIALKWRINNAVIYNKNKTKAVLFFKAYWQKLVKLLETRVRIDRKIVCFKKKRYLMFGNMAR